MSQFEPDFPRAAAEALRDAALVLEIELDLQEDPLEVEHALAQVQLELGALLPYARAWAEHHGIAGANSIPDAIDPNLNVEETVAFLRDVAATLERLARVHERRQVH